jgi:hypothetical protein
MPRSIICATLAGLLLTGTVVLASPSQGKGKKDAQHGGPKVAKGKESDVSVGIQLVFASADVTILRSHYAPRYRNLPPGLQKKVARGGQLPPGWRKKFEPFPVVLEQQLPLLPAGYRRGVIDAHAVIYNSRTNVIVDVAVLF